MCARPLIATLIACSIVPVFSFAATLLVPVDYPTIQSCIDAAVSGQDECVVVPGTYNELINFLGKAITLRSSHGPQVTTIDGTGLNGSVITCVTGEVRDTVLDGLTITAGTGTYLSMFNGYVGGGMYIAGSSPSVIGCVFSANKAKLGAGIYSADGSMAVSDSTFSENVAFSGGGIFHNGGSPTVSNCNFTANVADHGGGVVNSETYATLADCTFSGNTAVFGGGMYSNWGSPTVTRCIFVGNRGDHGGGMFNSPGDPIVTDCEFKRNTAMYGGGMRNDYVGYPTVSACKFSENKATHEGGGMYNFSINSAHSNLQVRYCIFNGNSAQYGGGIFDYFDNLTVMNSNFSGNTAISGGGIHNQNSNLEIINCTFSENGGESEKLETAGAVFARDHSQTVISNCVFWADRPNEIYHDLTSTLTIGSTNIQGGLPVSARDDGGNNALDPQLVHAPSDGGDGWGDDPFTQDIDESLNNEYGDSRLQAGSPCINAGDPDFVPEVGETDLDGHARILCGQVDMGAYEFGIGDYDCDQSVDLVDFGAWEACETGRYVSLSSARSGAGIGGPSTTTGSASLHAWQPSAAPAGAGSCESFDFDGDGDVDLRDLAQFMLVASP